VDAGHGIAGVASLGYLGLLAGPPLIGLAADAFGLRLALAIVGVACGVIALGAGIVPAPANDATGAASPRLAAGTRG
jgi:hypothetical protein